MSCEWTKKKKIKYTLQTRGEGFQRATGARCNNLVEDRELFRLEQSKGQQADFKLSFRISKLQEVLHGFGFVVSSSLLWQRSTYWRSTKGPMTPNRLHVCLADRSLTPQHLLYKSVHILILIGSKMHLPWRHGLQVREEHMIKRATFFFFLAKCSQTIGISINQSHLWINHWLQKVMGWYLNILKNTPVFADQIQGDEWL